MEKQYIAELEKRNSELTEKLAEALTIIATKQKAIEKIHPTWIIEQRQSSMSSSSVGSQPHPNDAHLVYKFGNDLFCIATIEYDCFKSRWHISYVGGNYGGERTFHPSSSEARESVRCAYLTKYREMKDNEWDM